MLVSKTAGTGFSDSFLVFVAGDGTIGGGIGNSISADVLSTSTSPSPGVWHHFAYVYGGTSHQIYLDGVLAGSAATAPAIAYDSDPPPIGADIDREAVTDFFAVP